MRVVALPRPPVGEVREWDPYLSPPLKVGCRWKVELRSHPHSHPQSHMYYFSYFSFISYFSYREGSDGGGGGEKGGGGRE